VDTGGIAQKVISRIYDGVKTSELDEACGANVRVAGDGCIRITAFWRRASS